MFRERQGPPGPGGWLRLWLPTLAGVRGWSFGVLAGGRRVEKPR